MIAARIKAGPRRIRELLGIMSRDEISKQEFIYQLRDELGQHHDSTAFRGLQTMGEVLRVHLQLLLAKEFTQSADFLESGNG